MTRYKVIVQHEVEGVGTRVPGTTNTYIETVHEITSSDLKVVAAFLRAMADSYDGGKPKPVVRDGSSVRKINELTGELE